MTEDAAADGAAEAATEGDIVDAAVEQQTTPAAPARELRVWVPAARPPVVHALEVAGATILDDPEGAQFAVISTRLAPHRVDEYILHARECELPVLVLVHPGGEAEAVAALRAGGRTAIAEGDVDALSSLRDGGHDTDTVRMDSILDAFETRIGRLQTSMQDAVAMVDSVSGLPAEGALRLRLADTTAGNEQPLRIVAMSVPALTEPKRLHLGTDGQTLLHRRIAGGMRLLCQDKGELFDAGSGGFTLVSSAIDSDGVQQLGAAMAAMVEAYSPDGQSPLAIAIGHAGPECSPDAATLRELAARAEVAARQEETSAIFGASELARPVATATGLDVTLRLAQLAAERTGATTRDEVAEVATKLAMRLDLESREQLLVRFCAAVSDIGAALVDSDGSNETEAAATLLDPIAGSTVGTVLRAIGEHWDGSGSPDGVTGAAIPMSARIIAVAQQLVADNYATATIEAGAQTRFDPAIVRAAMELARQR